MRYYTSSSGGLTSLITGGDSLQGAVQGLVVYFANHLAHPSENNPLKKVPKGEKLYALEEFTASNRGCTYDEIINQREPKQGMPGGPKMRYVRNPIDNNVMDMRHVLFVGFKLGYIGGMLVEHVQLALGDPSKSAYHAQDYYSNYIGAAFSLYKDFVGFRIDFTSKFEIYMKNILPKFNNDVIRYAKQYGKDW